jgi:Holliday junction resolvasome RuvABC DNA-binding subunit
MDDVAIAAPTGGAGGSALDEAVKALVALGYSSADAAAAVRKVMDEQGALAPVDLIKAALAGIKR